MVIPTTRPLPLPFLASKKTILTNRIKVMTSQSQRPIYWPIAEKELSASFHPRYQRYNETRVVVFCTIMCGHTHCVKCLTFTLRCAFARCRWPFGKVWVYTRLRREIESVDLQFPLLILILLAVSTIIILLFLFPQTEVVKAVSLSLASCSMLVLLTATVRLQKSKS